MSFNKPAKFLAQKAGMISLWFWLCQGGWSTISNIWKIFRWYSHISLVGCQNSLFAFVQSWTSFDHNSLESLPVQLVFSGWLASWLQCAGCSWCWWRLESWRDRLGLVPTCSNLTRKGHSRNSCLNLPKDQRHEKRREVESARVNQGRCQSHHNKARQVLMWHMRRDTTCSCLVSSIDDLMLGLRQW